MQVTEITLLLLLFHGLSIPPAAIGVLVAMVIGILVTVIFKRGNYNGKYIKYTLLHELACIIDEWVWYFREPKVIEWKCSPWVYQLWCYYSLPQCCVSSHTKCNLTHSGCSNVFILIKAHHCARPVLHNSPACVVLWYCTAWEWENAVVKIPNKFGSFTYLASYLDW